MINQKIKQMTTCALMAAVMCILGPLSIQIGPIPITFTNLVIYLAVYILGIKRAEISYLVYYLLGLFGLPVFSGGGAGASKAFGVTGGFLAGFFIMALVCGLFICRDYKLPRAAVYVLNIIGMLLGTAIAYAFGTLWYVIAAKTTLLNAVTVCVFPFIIGDLAKIVIALILGNILRARLKQSGMI